MAGAGGPSRTVLRGPSGSAGDPAEGVGLLLRRGLLLIAERIGLAAVGVDLLRIDLRRVDLLRIHLLRVRLAAAERVGLRVLLLLLLRRVRLRLLLLRRVLARLGVRQELLDGRRRDREADADIAGLAAVGFVAGARNAS